MTPEEELLANPNWYDGRKRSWAPGDLAQAYTLYNRLFKTNKKDTDVQVAVAKWSRR